MLQHSSRNVGSRSSDRVPARPEGDRQLRRHPSRPRRQHVDPARQVHRLLHVVGDHEDGGAGVGLHLRPRSPASTPGSASPAPRTARRTAAPTARWPGPGRWPPAAACRPTAAGAATPANVGQPHHRQVPGHPLGDVGLAQALQLQPEGHVLRHRAPGVERVALEDQAPVGPGPGDVVAVDQHRPVGGARRARRRWPAASTSRTPTPPPARPARPPRRGGRRRPAPARPPPFRPT